MNSTAPTTPPTTLPSSADVVGALGGGFVADTVTIDDTMIHYVRGGQGPTIVLLHGFPQDWFEWRWMMPRLAEQFTVIAPDLPGVGGSTSSSSGHSAVELARDVHQLIESLELGPVHVVGHDIGGGVAYAYAREFPDRTRSVTIVEFPIPGIEPEPTFESGPPLWHVAFHMTPGLPEALVAGRQTAYFRYFFDEFTAPGFEVSGGDVEHYAQAYRDPNQLRSAFEFFRALPANAAYNAAHTDPIDVPLLLVGGEQLFGPVVTPTAQSLRTRYGWSQVTAATIEHAKHYLPEEQPERLAALIEDHTEPAANRRSRPWPGAAARRHNHDRAGVSRECPTDGVTGPLAPGVSGGKDQS